MAGAVEKNGPGRGRPKGSVNKFTSAVRTAFELAFQDLQKIPGRGQKDVRLVKWARDNPAEFYKMCARMIPQEVSGPGGGAIPIAASGQLVLYMPNNGRVQPQGQNLGSKLPTRPRGQQRDR